MINKKVCALAAAVVLSFQIFGTNVLAEDFSVSINAPSKILAGMALSVNKTGEVGNLEYQWLSSDEEESGFVPLASDKDEKYIITPRDKGKYIKASVTDTETGRTTETAAVFVQNLGPVSRTTFKDDIESTMLTPQENIFSVSGQKFILLEEMNGANSHYYIMTERVYGSREFDKNGYAKFDPNADGNIGKFLNNEFLTSGGGGLVLPNEIKEHIDYEHIWNTEGGLKDGDCPEDYSFKAGISLLSMSEAVKYRSRYGWQPLGASVVTPWWGRTQRGSGGKADNILAMMNTNDGGKGNMWDRTCTEKYYIRPTFYLDEGFFKNVRCDLAESGDNVKNMLVSKYTLEEMKNLYSTEELILLGYDIKSAAISADSSPVKALTTLTASMKDKNAVDFEYKWFAADIEEEKGNEIYLNNTNQYIVAANDMGKWISAEVTPIYEGGVRGESVMSVNKIHIEQLGASNRTNYTDDRAELKDNPQEYLISAGGEKLIMLDASGDENDALYVMTAEAKGTHVFDSDNTQKFDLEDKNNIGFWLNNEFITSGGISADVCRFINSAHLWWTEAANNKGACPNDYSFTGAAALLSRSEYSKYWGRFGWDPKESIQTSWWLRSGRNTGVSDVFCGTGVKDGNFSNPAANGYGNTWNKAANASYYVRPTFYLNRDFALNVRITEAGAKAAAALSKMYTVEELLSCNAGYTENDLIKLGIIAVPKAENAKIRGLAAVGATIFGDYSYMGTDEGTSKCGFEISASKNGSYTAISNDGSVKLSAEHAGKYVRFFVVPINEKGYTGEKCSSEPLRVGKSAGLSAEEVIVTDESGKAAADIKNASELNVRIKLANCTGSACNAKAMLFVYDKDGSMLDNRGVSVNIPAGEKADINNLSLSLPSYSDGNYAKVIIWDGLTTMKSAQNYSVVIK